MLNKLKQELVFPLFDRFDTNNKDNQEMFFESLYQSIENILSNFLREGQYDKKLQLTLNDENLKTSTWAYEAMIFLSEKEPRLFNPQIELIKFDQKIGVASLRIVSLLRDLNSKLDFELSI